MTTNFPIDLGAYVLYRGDASGRNKVTITLLDSNDDPVDLGTFGSSWQAQARVKVTSQAKIDLDVDDTDGASGVLEVRMPDASSADMPSEMVFDVQALGGMIDPLTVFKGKFCVDGEVTR